MAEEAPAFESAWTSVAGLAMHARVSQSGPGQRGTPIVLVPGLGLSSRATMPTARVLASAYRVYAVDLPGYGLSAKLNVVFNIQQLAESLHAWMEAEALQHAIVVANSVGCQIAADMAARHPDRTDRLVLAGPTMPPAARNLSGALARWLRELPMETSLMPTMLRDYRDCGLRRFMGLGQYAREDALEDKVPLLEMPVLVMRGSRDHIVSQEWVEHIARRIPHGRMMVVPKAAHNLTFLAPVEVAERMSLWLNELRRSRGRTRRGTEQAA